MYPGSALVGLSSVFEILFCLPLLVLLKPHLPLAPDLHRQVLGKGVHHRDPDPVESAGDPVDLAVELSAGVKHGHHDLHGGLSRLVVNVDRNSPSVVLHRYAFVHVNGDGDVVAESRQGFVHAVVENLEDKMVKPAGIGVPDVHVRAFSHGFEAGENLYLLGGVLAVRAEVAAQLAHCFGFLRLAQVKHLPVKKIARL